jgi:plastocyanin
VHFKRTLIVIALTTLIGSACAQEGGGRATVLDVTAVDFGFQGAAEEIRGGRVDLTFTNNGKANHEFAIVNGENVEASEFQDGLADIDEGGAFPDFMKRGVAPFELEPGETRSTSFTLPEGDYFLFCALKDKQGGEGDEQPEGESHMELGMLQPLKVAGENERPLEGDDGTIVARDYTFDVPADIQAGKQTFVFRNDGPEQWHHMELMAFPQGTNEDDALSSFRTLGGLKPGEAPPEGTVFPEEAGSVGILSPGRGLTVDLELKPATYLALCFLPDTDGGEPHAFRYNMVKVFAVPG